MHQLTDAHCDPTMWGQTLDDRGLGYRGTSR
jgi:hypothetical protein